MKSNAFRTRDWTVPQEEQIVSDLYRIPMPIPNDGLHAINVYILIGEDGFTLIDSGWDSHESWELLGDVLHRLGGTVKDINRVLVTHGHRDHYTLAMKVREASNAKVYLGARERPLIDSVMQGWGRALEIHMSRLQQAGSDELVRNLREFLKNPPDYARAADHYEYPDMWLADGDVIESSERQLTAFDTPGHTVGHLVYADFENNLLFGGDHLLPHITPSISFEPAPSRGPLGSFLESQRRILELPDLLLLPAHGPQASSTHQRAHQLLKHHEDRLTQTHDALRRGATTIHEIASQLTWTRHNRRLSDLDIFNQLLAVNETTFHVDELISRGFVEDGRKTATGKRLLRPIK